ncbi:hypothetical protein BDV96DRAFT_644732 [Lophiotrema nucula]|uniref:Uncharacterized protein n=1 Tax=Lophiotrema nucula TaxID=690887 RepID=A0A6A5ZG19_9PLEO|nr:hypothetical protein BDV96DRAFT_644732 [Lophiotrema nucula]
MITQTALIVKTIGGPVTSVPNWRIPQPGPKSESKALQEYAVLDEDFAAAIPDGIREDEAATLPTNLLAGIIGFFDPDGLVLTPPWSRDADPASLVNSSILIIGRGSNCGRFATQLARLVGFTTIVVVGGKDSELKAFGATHVVDRHGGHDAVLQRIHDIVGNQLLYAFDAYNAPEEQHWPSTHYRTRIEANLHAWFGLGDVYKRIRYVLSKTATS